MFACNHITQTQSQDDSTCSDLRIDTETLSKAELAAMNRVLMWVFDCTDSDEFVHRLFRELRGVANINECALYIVTEDGAALKLDVNARDGKNNFPDIIPHTSDLYWAILSGRRASGKPTCAAQLNLFDEWPDCIFRPIFRHSAFTACLALAHASGNIDFIDMILAQATLVLELLWRTEAQPDRQAQQQSASFNQISKLTAREAEVLNLMADGMSNKEIAGRLYISVATCKRHVENVLTKLEVHSRCAAVSMWLAGSDLRISSRRNQFSPC